MYEFNKRKNNKKLLYLVTHETNVSIGNTPSRLIKVNEMYFTLPNSYISGTKESCSVVRFILLLFIILSSLDNLYATHLVLNFRLRQNNCLIII